MVVNFKDVIRITLCDNQGFDKMFKNRPIIAYHSTPPPCFVFLDSVSE